MSKPELLTPEQIRKIRDYNYIIQGIHRCNIDIQKLERQDIRSRPTGLIDSLKSEKNDLVTELNQHETVTCMQVRISFHCPDGDLSHDEIYGTTKVDYISDCVARAVAYSPAMAKSIADGSMTVKACLVAVFEDEREM